MTQATITVRGKVQGVGFRMGFKTLADNLGLVGYVQNEPGGSVRAVAQGRNQAVQALIDWAQVGPAASLVGSVEVDLGESSEVFTGFEIRS